MLAIYQSRSSKPLQAWRHQSADLMYEDALKLTAVLLALSNCAAGARRLTQISVEPTYTQQPLTIPQGRRLAV